MYIYLDGELIYKPTMSTTLKKHGCKMWVFENKEDINPTETNYCDFKLIARDENGTNLETYFIDKNGNYWKKEKCYFSQLLAQNERQLRLNKKYSVKESE